MTNYASFNVLTVTGRIAKSDIVDGKKGRFLSVTVLSTATKDGETLAYTFTNNNGMVTLAEKGMLPVGREVTVTGHLAGVKSYYEAKDGSLTLLKTPELQLLSATILDGGFGRMPMDKQVNRGGMTVQKPSGAPAVDKTPVIVGYDK